MHEKFRLGEGAKEKLFAATGLCLTWYRLLKADMNLKTNRAIHAIIEFTRWIFLSFQYVVR